MDTKVMTNFTIKGQVATKKLDIKGVVFYEGPDNQLWVVNKETGIVVATLFGRYIDKFDDTENAEIEIEHGAVV